MRVGIVCSMSCTGGLPMIASPGDIVARRKGLVLHKGVVLHDGRVLHNTPERGEHVSSLADFAAGERVQVERQPFDARRAALRRAERLSFRRGYDLLGNNCEHTVTRVAHGRPHSPQLGNWLLGAGVALAVFAVSRHPGWAVAAGAAVAKARE
jgi:hypothetical protein